MPKPLPSLRDRAADPSSGAKAPRNTPPMTSSTAQSASVSVPGQRRSSIHTAMPSIIRPKAALTETIQAPAFGISRPAEAPMASSGMPMPMPSANSASAPRATSPVFAITVRAATSGGVTQVVTTAAEITPMMAAPMKLPDFCSPEIELSRVCQDAGICRSKRPNMERARATNSRATPIVTAGCCMTACTWEPAAAKTAPSTV